MNWFDWFCSNWCLETFFFLRAFYLWLMHKIDSFYLMNILGSFWSNDEFGLMQILWLVDELWFIDNLAGESVSFCCSSLLMHIDWFRCALFILLIFSVMYSSDGFLNLLCDYFFSLISVTFFTKFFYFSSMFLSWFFYFYSIFLSWFSLLCWDVLWFFLCGNLSGMG